MCQRESESLVHFFLLKDNLNNNFDIFPQIYLNNNPDIFFNRSDIFPQIQAKIYYLRFQSFKHNIQLDSWDITLLGKCPPPPSKWPVEFLPRRAYMCYIFRVVGCLIALWAHNRGVVCQLHWYCIWLYVSWCLHWYCIYCANNWGVVCKFFFT